MSVHSWDRFNFYLRRCFPRPRQYKGPLAPPPPRANYWAREIKVIKAVTRTGAKNNSGEDVEGSIGEGSQPTLDGRAGNS